METTTYTHSFFPTGCGIAIIWNNELTLFYSIGDSFTVWSTSSTAPNTPDELRLFMDAANTISRISDQGVSQIGTLNDVLEDMPDQVLGAIYKAVVGYDPFIDNPNDPIANRALVAEYLTMPETLEEVFNYKND